MAYKKSRYFVVQRASAKIQNNDWPYKNVSEELLRQHCIETQAQKYSIHHTNDCLTWKKYVTIKNSIQILF
jgi:hypothetical protein